MLAAFKEVWVTCKRSSKGPERQEPTSVLSTPALAASSSAPHSYGPSVPAAGSLTLSGFLPFSRSPVCDWSQSRHLPSARLLLGLCQSRPHPVTGPHPGPITRLLVGSLRPLSHLPGPPRPACLLPTPVWPARHLTVCVRIPGILGCLRQCVRVITQLCIHIQLGPHSLIHRRLLLLGTISLLRTLYLPFLPLTLLWGLVEIVARILWKPSHLLHESAMIRAQVCPNSYKEGCLLKHPLFAIYKPDPLACTTHLRPPPSRRLSTSIFVQLYLSKERMKVVALIGCVQFNPSDPV